MISYLSTSIFSQMISTWQNYGTCFIEIGPIKIFMIKPCKICSRLTKRLKRAKECITPLFSFRYSATVCKPLDDNLVNLNVCSEQFFLCKWHLLFLTDLRILALEIMLHPTVAHDTKLSKSYIIRTNLLSLEFLFFWKLLFKHK